MIEIHPLRDKNKLSALYNECNIEIKDNSIAIVANDGDIIIGSCLFDLCEDCVIIHKVNPDNDYLLADGLLRSALHVGVENGKNSAFYSSASMDKLFESLKFIKNKSKRELDVNKLFASCENC